MRRIATGSVTVRVVSGTSSTRPRYASSAPSGSPARRTRPIDVGYAGSREPTDSDTVMIRFVGIRDTYTISSPSRTLMDDDSCRRSTSVSMCGCASSQNGVLERYA
jgi:hypothetical protein